MEKLTLEECNEFYELLIENDSEHQRRGQFMFNTLYAVNQDVANEVRGTENDPFYNDKFIPQFLKTILPDTEAEQILEQEENVHISNPEGVKKYDP